MFLANAVSARLAIIPLKQAPYILAVIKVLQCKYNDYACACV
nr:MAG TPA: hypothetical protein [Caudoviricetes sp.]